MESQEQRAARLDLVRAIKRAKSAELNVGAIFYEVAAEIKLLHFRLTGAMLAGGFVVSAPLLIRVMDMYCALWHLDIRMDYRSFDYVCLFLGVPSMLAFAWRLRSVKPEAAEHLIPAIGEITLRLQHLEDEDEDEDDGADGGV